MSSTNSEKTTRYGWKHILVDVVCVATMVAAVFITYNVGMKRIRSLQAECSRLEAENITLRTQVRKSSDALRQIRSLADEALRGLDAATPEEAESYE